MKVQRLPSTRHRQRRERGGRLMESMVEEDVSSRHSRAGALLSGINFHSQSFCAERSAVAESTQRILVHRRMDSATSRGMTQLSRRNVASPVSPVRTTLSCCSSSFIPDSIARRLESKQRCCKRRRSWIPACAGMTKS